MLSPKEREERKKQLGASEIHKILNFDSQLCQDLWELKMGLQDSNEIDNDAITAGNILEEDCLSYFSQKNKVELFYNERIEHQSIPGLVISLDARIQDTSIPVENKVINERIWQKWIAKKNYNATYGEIKLNIPTTYFCQIQTQIAVLDVEKGILNVNTLTDEEQEDPINVTITDLHNKQIEVFRDDDLIRELEQRARYMLSCITHKQRPSESNYLEKEVF